MINQGNRASNANIRKIIVTVIAIFIILFSASFWSMIAANYNREDARRIAQNHIGAGVATTAEWDWEVWRWTLYVEVRNQGDTFGVYINPVNGNVIRTDSW